MLHICTSDLSCLYTAVDKLNGQIKSYLTPCLQTGGLTQSAGTTATIRRVALCGVMQSKKSQTWSFWSGFEFQEFPADICQVRHVHTLSNWLESYRISGVYLQNKTEAVRLPISHRCEQHTYKKLTYTIHYSLAKFHIILMSIKDVFVIMWSLSYQLDGCYAFLLKVNFLHFRLIAR